MKTKRRRASLFQCTAQWWAFSLFLAINAPAADFSYLKVDGQTVVTTHDLPATIELGDGYDLVGIVDFVENYGGPDFNISASVFADDQALVTVHAEMYSDGRGGLDYSDLPSAVFRGQQFFVRAHCADLREETAEDISANGLLRFLVAKEYNLDTAMEMLQYLRTNTEGTAEIVLSYVKRVPACSESSAHGLQAGLERSAESAFAAVAFGEARAR